MQIPAPQYSNQFRLQSFRERKEVAQVLKGLISKDQIPQQELSKFSSVPQSVISRWLSGATKVPKAETLQQIAKALGTTVTEIAANLGSPRQSTEPQEQKQTDATPEPLRDAPHLSTPESGQLLNKTATRGHLALSSVEQLLHAFDSADKSFQCILTSDGPDATGELAEATRASLNAEACALYVMKEPGKLAVEASCSQRCPPHLAYGEMVEMKPIPNGGLVGPVAQQFESTGQSVLRYSHRELVGNLFVPLSYQPQLSSGRLFSCMLMALRDRKTRLIGILLVENKKGDNGNIRENPAFSEADELLGLIFARKAVLIIETIRRLATLHGILQTLQESTHLDTILNHILTKCIRLLGADRGDFALWDASKGDLIMRAIAGPTSASTIHLRAPVPERSFMRSAWVAKENYLVTGDVRQRPADYYQSHPSTKSELAVRFTSAGRPIGVLSVESFQQNAFDADDRDLLLLLAKYAAIAVQIADEETLIGTVVQRILDYSEDAESVREILANLLETAKSIFLFDRGIIYIARDDEEKLTCEASVGCEHLAQDPKKWVYNYTDQSAATWILKNRRDLFSTTPARDPLVNPEGLKYFQIDGPLLGLPLLYSNRVVGVMICWSRGAVPVTPYHIERLTPLAKLAAWAISAWQARKRLEESQRIYRSLVETLPVSVFQKDRSGRFTFVNTHFAASLGKSPDEVIGLRDYDFYPLDLADAYREDDLQVMQNRQQIAGKSELNIDLSSGKKRHVQVSKMPITTSAGEVIGVQGVFLVPTEEGRAHPLGRKIKKLR